MASGQRIDPPQDVRLLQKALAPEVDVNGNGARAGVIRRADQVEVELLAAAGNDTEAAVPGLLFGREALPLARLARDQDADRTFPHRREAVQQSNTVPDGRAKAVRADDEVRNCFTAVGEK